MKDIWTIVKKELIRVFKDPKLVLMMFILPGLMIYGLYSIMGVAMKSFLNPDTEKNVTIYHVNDVPQTVINVGGVEVTFESLMDQVMLDYNVEMVEIESSEIETYKEDILSGKVALVIEFDKDFDVNVESTTTKPYITCYYNPGEDESSALYEKMSDVISQYQDYLVNEKIGDVTVFTSNVTPIFEESKVLGKSMALFLPFLIITFLFEGALAIAPESIAGEKERATIATLLVTPVKRSYIALGKIISLSIVAIISSISSFLGTILAIPQMMKGIIDAGLDYNIYGVKEYFAVLFILLSTAIILVGLLSICSALAKNVKEASMLMTPIMILSMGVSMLSMFSSSAPTNIVLYFIPVYNSVMMLQQVFSFNINYGLLVVTIVSNLCYSVICAFVLTKLFNSEKVMFSK